MSLDMNKVKLTADPYLFKRKFDRVYLDNVFCNMLFN